MFKLRDYQEEISNKGVAQCLDRGWCYLSMEVRTGKSFTSLSIAAKLPGESKRVVFVTKKKAIPSVESDVSTLNDPTINVETINYESLHKIDLTTKVDVWILDEAHKLGQVPKPSKKTKMLRDSIKKESKVIFLSGTPTPENGSQIFHQMYVLGERSPFGLVNFYKWAKVHVNVTKKKINGFMINDYTRCTFDIKKLNFLSYSQKQAGFENEIKEHFLTVEMSDTTKQIIRRLKKDKVVEGSSGVILADTAVKEMQKVHQLSSGTIKLEEGNTVIIDKSKAEFIKRRFNSEKIAIFYKFKAELELLKEFFDITQDIEEFNSNNEKTIALQFVSGREGIKLDKADCIVAFNIDFSATTYWQFRDRMTTIDSKEGNVYFIVSDCGIEMDVYRAVTKKKNFTKRFYERVRVSEKNK